MPRELTIDELLQLSDEDLARLCKFEAYKSGGPGGQKRNKTSSAAKMTHPATGISAHSNDFREQSKNRVRALHRLRFKFATTVRTPLDRRGYEPPPWVTELKLDQSKFTTNPKNPAYARLAAHVLDLFAAVDARLADAAALLGVSNSHLVHFLQAEPTVWAAAAKLRAANQLPSLSER